MDDWWNHPHEMTRKDWFMPKVPTTGRDPVEELRKRSQHPIRREN